jgi:hypothetical protein
MLSHSAILSAAAVALPVHIWTKRSALQLFSTEIRCAASRS